RTCWSVAAPCGGEEHRSEERASRADDFFRPESVEKMTDDGRDDRVDYLHDGKNAGGDRAAPSESIEQRDIEDAEGGSQPAAEAEDEKGERRNEPGTMERAHVRRSLRIKNDREGKGEK